MEAAAAAAAAWSGLGAPAKWLPKDILLGGKSSLGGKDAADGGSPGIPAIEVINPGGGTPPGNCKENMNMKQISKSLIGRITYIIIS